MAAAPVTGDRRLLGGLRERALALGLTAPQIADASVPPDRERAYRRALAQGHHASMTWLERTADRRSQPRGMWPEARTAIVLGLNYGPESDPLSALIARAHGAISVYAQGDDYHDVFKGRLKTLAGWFASASGASVKVFVDTAPLLEKPLAEQAGLGWQGKHTNLVSREHGSWLFLGTILTTAPLPPDEAETDHCGACRRCLDICPTDAFPEPYKLDARRCISYLTIEHAGPIPHHLRRAIGNRIYGCDDCLAVCPWNKFAAQAAEIRLQARAANKLPALADLAAMDDAAFRQRFAKSPIKRSGWTRFLRNVLIAIGNSGDAALAPSAAQHLTHNSPVVRGAAIWATLQLSDPATAADLARRHLPGERDPAVRREWSLAAADSATHMPEA